MQFVIHSAENESSKQIRLQLVRRAERMVELLNLSVISKEIVAREVFNIFRIGLAYCGRSLVELFFSWLREDNSTGDLSVCGNCTNFKKGFYGQCSSCSRSATPTKDI